MSILNLFENLDMLAEAYNGSYKSPYAGLTPAERKAAAFEYAQKRDHTWAISRNGITMSQSHYAGKYIIDYENFHKAYDADLAILNLLTCFEVNGELGPASTWGNIITIQKGSPEAQSEAYQALIELWGIVHGGKKGGGAKIGGRWLNNQQLLDRQSKTISNIKANDLVNQAQEAQKLKKQEEEDRIRKAEEAKKAAENAKLAKEQAEREAADVAFDKLSDALDKALNMVDPEIFIQLEDYKNSIEEELGDLEIEGEETYNTLNIPGVGKLHISNDNVGKMTPDILRKIIEERVQAARLPYKQLEEITGISKVKESLKYNPDFISCFFIDCATNEIYKCDQSFILKDFNNKDITLKQMEQAELIFCEISFADSYNSNCTSQDNHWYRYYSWADEFTTHPKIANYIPKKISNWDYNELTEFSDPEDIGVTKKQFFISYENIDRWVYEKYTQTSTD